MEPFISTYTLGYGDYFFKAGSVYCRKYVEGAEIIYVTFYDLLKYREIYFR